MNKKVEELVERVRLTPEKIKSLRPRPLDCGMCDISVKECGLTELDKARCWAKRVAEAQLNKVLKEDLALIDREHIASVQNEHLIAFVIPLKGGLNDNRGRTGTH